ncbi:hypothetical protein EKN38_20935 [Enterobacter sp. WCHEn045836]|nr:hypothetical protein [Enterobacter sp.]RTP98318.1 hypothetical protein EKN38_20935 [Enterobacter sp. WCHEn045836]
MVNRAYVPPTPAKSGVGIGIPVKLNGGVSSCCAVRLATFQWWAGRGRRKTRRCPLRPVMPTPFSPATREIGISLAVS